MPPLVGAIPAALMAGAMAGGMAGIGAVSLATGFSFLGLTGALGYGLFAGAVSLGLGTVTNLLTGSSTGANSSSSASVVQPVKLNFGQDSQEQRIFGYGLVTSGGTCKYWKTSGADNKFLWVVVAYHDTPIDGVTGFYCNGALESFSGADATGIFSGVMSRYDKLGTIDQTVETNLNAAVAEWTTAHRLRGIAYYVWKLAYDAEKYSTGRPEPLIEFKARKVWDLRKDPAYGGVGSHSLNDETTWEWSTNVALCCLDYLKGIKLNGVFIAGMKCPVEGLDLDLWIAAANVCDEDVALKAGGTEKRYTINGMIGSLENKQAVFASMLQAMAAVPVIVNGKLGIVAGAASSSVVTLTDDDLAGAMSVTPIRSFQEKHNTITSVYYDRLSRNGVKDSPTLTVPAYVVADGGITLEREVRHRFTSSLATVQRLNKIFLANEREQLFMEALWKPKAARIPVYGSFLWASAAAGYTQKMRVMGRQRQPDGSFQLIARQETDAKYAWAQATEEQDAPSFAAHVGFNASTVTAPAGGSVSVGATTIDGAAGSKVPAFLLSATVSPSPFVLRVLTRYRLSSSSPWQTGPTIEPGGSAYIQALAPGVNYDFGFAYETNLGVSSYTAVMNVLAGNWTVTTEMINVGAVTKRMEALMASSADVDISDNGSGLEVTIASGTYDASGGRVLVELKVTLTSDGSNPNYSIAVYRDAVAVRSFDHFEFSAVPPGTENSALFWADGGSASSHTWSLKGQDQTGGDAQIAARDVEFSVTDWAR